MVIVAKENVIAARAFLVGVIIAILVGIFFGSGVLNSKINALIVYILAALGIIVGFFVAQKDVQTFLLASVSLVIVSYTGLSGLTLGASIQDFNLGGIITSALNALLAMFIPATIIVAVKTVFSISKS